MTKIYLHATLNKRKKNKQSVSFRTRHMEVFSIVMGDEAAGTIAEK